VLNIYKNSHNLSEAGRGLFTVYRQAKGKTNDADRLRKYLARFGLKWVDNVFP
jgi:transcriptional regulatory protein RtcR